MIKKMKLKRIGLMSVVKIGGIVSAVMGFFLGTIWGIFMALFSSAMGAALSMDTSGIGMTWIIIFPIIFMFLYGTLGMLLSFLIALLYNIAAGVLGGIEIETEEDEMIETEMKISNDIYSEQ